LRKGAGSIQGLKSEKRGENQVGNDETSCAKKKAKWTRKALRNFKIKKQKGKGICSPYLLMEDTRRQGENGNGG